MAYSVSEMYLYYLKSIKCCGDKTFIFQIKTFFFLFGGYNFSENVNFKLFNFVRTNDNWSVIM